MNNSSGIEYSVGMLVLQLLFIIFKLTNAVSWSWLKVFLPSIISIGVLLLGLSIVIGAVLFVSAATFYKWLGK